MLGHGGEICPMELPMLAAAIGLAPWYWSRPLGFMSAARKAVVR